MVIQRSTQRREPESVPRITFELRPGNTLNVEASWPRGGDVDAFATLLVYLCTGKLVGAINAAVSIHGTTAGDEARASHINGVLQTAMQAARPAAPARDEPVVCPTRAVRVNMRPFQD